MSEYEDIFNGLGCITDVVHHIETDPNVKPKIHPNRRVPVAFRAKIKVELESMEKQGIIQKVNGPSEWVNSLVTIVNIFTIFPKIKWNGRKKCGNSQKNIEKGKRRQERSIFSNSRI